MNAPPIELLSPLLLGLQQDLSSVDNLVPAVILDDDELETLYAVGHRHYGHGQYDKALRVFHLLLRQDVICAKHHFAVAACLHRLGRHREAASSYCAAYALDVDDPVPLFHIADCLIQLNEWEAAEQTLLRFLEAADGVEPLAEQRAQACSMLMTVRGRLAHPDPKRRRAAAAHPLPAALRATSRQPAEHTGEPVPFTPTAVATATRSRSSS